MDFLLTYETKLKNSIAEIQTFKWFESEEELKLFIKTNTQDIHHKIKPIEAIHILDDRQISL